MLTSKLVFIAVLPILHGMSNEIDWDGILAGYGEVAIKSSRVRRKFVRKLARNIIKGLREAGLKSSVHHKWSRLIIKVDDIDAAIKLLERIFGLVFIAPYKHVKLNELKPFLKENCQQLLGDAKSFAIRVKRTGEHPFTSKDLERELGALVKDAARVRVDLENPSKTIYVEVRGDDCYVYNEKIPCPGGLPLGVSGKVVCLISGGIDSPVASWLLMRRGCSIVPLFAYFPMGGDESDLKRFMAVIRILGKWHIGEPMPVYIYRHEHNLIAFRRAAPKYTCVLCRRMMYRVANELAKKVGAKAIATGENLAQVASQTLDNLMVINEASELPVLRPLIGFDKNESIALAKQIGTYEASCMKITSGYIPVKGCWARPPKPVTKAKLEEVLEIESKLDIEDLLAKSIESLREISSICLGKSN